MPQPGVHTLVVMARGLGTRMRAAADAVLTPEQQRAADKGVKAMIDVGRPFLDHVISAAADAGITDVVLVIGPEHDEIRRYYGGLATERVTVRFAVQEEPRGTGDAVRSARDAVGDADFIVLNSDNFYPTEVLRLLAEARGTALIGFDPDCLAEQSNIDPDRIRRFALLEVDDRDQLVSMVEKPDDATWERLQGSPVSMNCYRFTPAIFDHCDALPLSPRGEYELPDAVRATVASGEPVTVVRACAGVLDLSSRGDIGPVADALRGREVRL